MKHCSALAKMPQSAQINIYPILGVIGPILSILFWPFTLTAGLIGMKQFSDCVVDGEGNEICG